MSTSNVKIKDPSAILDYKWDFKPLTHLVDGAASDYLDTAETIVTATVTASTGIVIDSSSITDSSTSVSAWISGGTDTTEYTIVCRIVTSSGRTDERSLVIRVTQR